MWLMDKQRVLTLVFFVLLIPAVSFANSASITVAEYLGLLALANLAIGIGEGFLLGTVFKVSLGKSIFAMILANYFSAIVGHLIMYFAVEPFVHVTIGNVLFFFFAFYAISYLVTFVLEFPFVCFLFYKKKEWGKSTLVASLVVQTASYLVLFVFYCYNHYPAWNSGRLIGLEKMQLPGEVDIYFIGSDDGDVYKISLDDLTKKKVMELDGQYLKDRLVQKLSDSDKGKVDLVIGSHYNEDHRTVQESVALYKLTLNEDDGLTSGTTFHSTTTSDNQDDERVLYQLWRDNGNLIRLGTPETSEWKFRITNHAFGGLRAEKNHIGTGVWFTLRKPYFGVTTYIHCGMQLPNNIALFQLGEDEIYLFDPEEKTLAFLAKGYGPTAVIRDKNETSNFVHRSHGIIRKF